MIPIRFFVLLLSFIILFSCSEKDKIELIIKKDIEYLKIIYDSISNSLDLEFDTKNPANFKGAEFSIKELIAKFKDLSTKIKKLTYNKYRLTQETILQIEQILKLEEKEYTRIYINLNYGSVENQLKAKDLIEEFKFVKKDFFDSFKENKDIVSVSINDDMINLGL